MQRVVLYERFTHNLYGNASILAFRETRGVSRRLKSTVQITYASWEQSSSFLTIRDGGVGRYLDVKLYSSTSTVDSTEALNKKRLVVLGTGWGAINFLKDLRNTSFDVQVISRQNYFALNPLLPCVACGTLQARSIAEPVRILVRKKNVAMHLLEAECTKIDAENHKVHCRPSADNNLNGKEEFVVDYDYLVIAIGASTNTFSIPGVSEYCHFLKNLDDAQNIRSTIIDCFERASLPDLSEEERKRILHFVVVGGGPTGVELAGQLHDFVEKDLTKLYPKVKGLVKITLLEAADHILNMFNEKVRASAERKFQRDGIEVKKGAKVVKVSEKEIFIKEATSGEVKSLPYGMVVWSTGIETHSVVKDFIKQIGQADGPAVVTDEWLRVEGCDNIYAFGDCAMINQRKSTVDPHIKRLPATGQVASQQGAYLANCFNRIEECQKNPEGPFRFSEGGRYPFQPFRYNHQGLLVSLGGEKAGMQLPGGQEIVGRTAQSLWYFVYTSKLVSWRTRMHVLSEWTRRFLFGRDPNCF